MSKKTNFKYVNWVKRLNGFAQIFLTFLIVVGLNILAARHYTRVDLTQAHRYALSPETISYIRQLKEPIDIIVMLSDRREGREQLMTDVRGILKEFAYEGRATPENKIQVQYINIFQQRKKAEEIVQKYKLPYEDVIIVACNNRTQLLLDADLYQTKNGQVVSFKGEQSLLSAMLNVCNETKPKVGFVVGHGEMRVDDVDPLRGLTQAVEVLRQRNIAIGTVDLSTLNEIPNGIDALIIAGPRIPFLPMEVEKLRRYLSENHGRLIIFLEPGREHGLDDLLHEWGIRSEDMVILDSGEDYHSSSGDLVLRRFAKHPITQLLIDFQLGILVGLCRPVEIDAGAPTDEKRSTQLLIATSDTSWAEKAYHQPGTLQFTADIDLPGPVGVAVVSEQSVGTQIGIHIPTGRMVVFGNSDMISNNRLALMGNGVLFLNTVNWSLNRDHFLNIPPRKMEFMQLAITREDMWRLSLYLMLPAFLCIVVGGFIYWRRHR